MFGPTFQLDQAAISIQVDSVFVVGQIVWVQAIMFDTRVC